MTENEFVYFDGPFSRREKGQIGRAIREVEQQLPAVSPAGLGKPWVTVSVDLAGRSRLLVAHRLGTPQAVRASSVEELVEQLQTLPDSLPAHP